MEKASQNNQTFNHQNIVNTHQQQQVATSNSLPLILPANNINSSSSNNNSSTKPHANDSADFTDTDTSLTTTYSQRPNKKAHLENAATNSNQFSAISQSLLKQKPLTKSNLQDMQSLKHQQANNNFNWSLNSSTSTSQNKSIVASVVTSAATAEEKQKANRDRNREHARNTRLRKKAYLEKLKVTVDELCRERDSLIQERVTNANCLLETLATRTEVIIGFFALRQHPVKHHNHADWSSLISEHNFQILVPRN